MLDRVRAVTEPRAELVRFDGDDVGQRFDVLPLTVLTESMARAVGYDHRRFRPNLLIAGAPDDAELHWAGYGLRIGEALIGVRNRRSRCVMTTFDPDTLEQDPMVLLHVVRSFNGRVALDCWVERPAWCASVTGSRWSSFRQDWRRDQSPRSRPDAVRGRPRRPPIRRAQPRAGHRCGANGLRPLRARARAVDVAVPLRARFRGVAARRRRRGDAANAGRRTDAPCRRPGLLPGRARWCARRSQRLGRDCALRDAVGRRADERGDLSRHADVRAARSRLRAPREARRADRVLGDARRAPATAPAPTSRSATRRRRGRSAGDSRAHAPPASSCGSASCPRR